MSLTVTLWWFLDTATFPLWWCCYWRFINSHRNFSPTASVLTLLWSLRSAAFHFLLCYKSDLINTEHNSSNFSDVITLWWSINFTCLVCYKFVIINAFATVTLFLCYNSVMIILYGNVCKDPKFSCFDFCFEGWKQLCVGSWTP